MKKLLGTMLAALLFMPWAASAEILSNLKVSGTLDLQANSGRNILNMHTRSAANDRIGDIMTRVTATMDWDLLDDVHAQVTLRKNDRSFGTTGNIAGGQQFAAGDQRAIGAAGAGQVASNIYLNRANATVDKLFGHFDVTLGRQYYGEPGDLVIYFGPKDTHGLFATSVDGVTLRSECDFAEFTGAALRTVDNSAGTAGGVGGVDNDVVGMEIGVKNMPLKLKPFVYRRTIHQTATLGSGGSGANANDQLWIYGLKVRGEAMGGWMNLDLVHNSGECRNTAGSGSPCVGRNAANYVGSAFLADLGYNVEVANVGGFTPWVNFGWGTGRSDGRATAGKAAGLGGGSTSEDGFQAIASDYRPGVINRRFNSAGLAATSLGTSVTAGGSGTAVDTVGLNNRVVYGLGVNMTPAALEKLTIGLSAWDFRYQRIDVANADFATASAGATGGAQGNKHIGSEFGLTFDWRHSENVKVGFGAATFMPGGFVRELSSRNGIGAVSPVKFAFADMGIKF